MVSRRNRFTHASVRSTTQRCRPNHSLESMPLRAIRLLCRVSAGKRGSDAHRRPYRHAVFPAGVQQGLERRAVVLISRRDAYRQRESLAVDPHVALGARFAPVGRVVGPVSGPPRLAGTLLLSRLARLQSIWPSQRSNSWWMRCHRPVACQSRSLRQQVMPEPQPSSLGSSSQGIPLRSTKRIPVRTCQ
jgi:hypothetical protein